MFDSREVLIAYPHSFDVYFMDMECNDNVIQLGKQMMDIDHKSHQCSSNQGGTRCQKIDSDELHRSRVNRQTHKEGPDEGIPFALQENSEAASEHEISGHYGQCGYKGEFYRVSFLIRIVIHIITQVQRTRRGGVW
jgi:hypothetical protein